MESLSERVKHKWRDISINGRKCNGITDSCNPDSIPEWFDETKFNKSLKLCQKYYSSLSFGNLIGLLLGLNHLEALIPLVMTGNSSNVQKLFRRYLSTILHVKNWYESNPFDKSSESYKSLKRVRNLHTRVAQTMNEKSGRVEGKDNLWISQFMMCSTQFAFIGYVVLYPKQCGLHSLSNEDFDCLIYMWRVIGYCLGIDHKYNLCSGTTEEVIQLCKLIFQSMAYPIINRETPDCQLGEDMAKGICLSLSGSVPKFVNWNVLMKYWYPILNVSKSIELQSFGEYFWYYMTLFIMNYGTKLSIFHSLMSTVTRIHIRIADMFKNYKYENLKKQYQHLSYDDKSCPFDLYFAFEDTFQTNEENLKTKSQNI